jgi:hypothetical protein
MIGTSRVCGQAQKLCPQPAPIPVGLDPRHHQQIPVLEREATDDELGPDHGGHHPVDEVENRSAHSIVEQQVRATLTDLVSTESVGYQCGHPPGVDPAVEADDHYRPAQRSTDVQVEDPHFHSSKTFPL